GPEGFFIGQRVSRTGDADNLDDRPDHRAGHDLPHLDDRLFWSQQPAGNTGARFVGAIVLAGTITALYVAFWRHCQMHPSIFLMVATEAGMSLNPVLHLARSCHVSAPFKRKMPMGGYPMGIVATSLSC